MRSCSDVHNYLEELGVAHEMLPLPGPPVTSERAADLLGVGVTEVLKSLLFLVDANPLLVLVPGDARVTGRRLAAALGARKASPARAQEVFETTGYRAGALPPCGLAVDLPVVADPGAFAPRVVYCGGGATATMLKIRSADLKSLLKPRLVDLAER